MKHICSIALLLAYGASLAHTQTAVITGQVRDGDGAPAVQTRVALVSMNEKGMISLDVLVGITTTDGSGRYRIENVSPGRYGLIAGAVEAPTFYPGTAEVSEARVISVAPGTTTTGLDFKLAPPLTSGRGGRDDSQADTPQQLFPNGVPNLPDNPDDLLEYLTELAGRRSEVLSDLDLRPAPTATTFDFAFTGVQDRTVTFADSQGRPFSFGCRDCSFLVWGFGIVVDASTNAGAGLVLKLSANGNSLAATCRDAECLIVSPDGSPISRLAATKTTASSDNPNLPIVSEIRTVGRTYFRITK